MKNLLCPASKSKSGKDNTNSLKKNTYDALVKNYYDNKFLNVVNIKKHDVSIISDQRVTGTFFTRIV